MHVVKEKETHVYKKEWNKGIERGVETDDRAKNGIAENLPH